MTTTAIDQPVAPAADQAPETMTVRVRVRAAESEWGHGFTNPCVRTVTISAYCPTCGGRRGTPANLNQCDDGAFFSTDIWTNACGHIDSYPAVVAEAAARTA